MILEQENALLRQALSEKEDELFQLKSIIDALPGHVYWKDLDSRMLGCNNQQALSAGFASSEKMIGCTEYEFTPDNETADQIIAFDKKVMATGQLHSSEEITAYHGAHKIFVLSQKSPLRNKWGETVGLIGISIDITKQKRLENTLKEQSAFLENLLNNFPLHIYWKDKEGKYLGANDQQAKSLGFANHRDLIGKTDFDLSYSREAALTFRENDFQVMNSGKPLVTEESAIFDGKPSVFLSYKSPLYDSNGALIGIIGTSFDITDRKRLETELQEKNTFLKNLINNFPLHVYWKDKDGRYLGANDLQAKSAGLQVGDDLIGKYDAELSTPEEVTVVQMNDQKVMQTQQTLMLEEPASFGGKSSIFLSCKSPLRDLKGEVIGIIGTSLDITEQKRLEAEKAQFYNSALQVAHDIRSPAAAIEMLAKSLGSLPEEQRVILRNATARINDIANQLLSKYRGETAPSGLQLELLSALLLNLISEKRLQLAKSQIQLEADISKRAYFAFAKIDPTELKRVLSNIINNAAEAMRFKGKITLQLDINDALEIVLNVKDEGPGIPPEILARLGEQGASFNKEGGSGLGLYHAKETMASFEGRLEIDSMVGQGTILSLILPDAVPPRWFANKLVLQPGQTLYIVDDDTAIHAAWDQRLQEVLRPEDDIKIVHFNNPDEALEQIIATRHTNVLRFNAVLLTDYELIGYEKTGIDLISAIGATTSILVTSYFEKKEIQDALPGSRAKLLPKNLASELPITVERGHYVTECEAVVLEDNTSLIRSIEWTADLENRKIKIYRTSAALFRDLPMIPKTMPFYLDNDIGEAQTGLEIGKILYDQGYQTLYFSTGAVDVGFVKPYWFLDVVDKDAVLK